MKSYELNLLPEKIQSGELTVKEAVNCICSFICENYPVFGLHKYDEDFREDILLYFLERGESFIKNYNESIADFFTYLYSHIMSYVNTKRRSLAKEYLKEAITISENSHYITEKESDYKQINYKTTELAKVPFSYKPITLENLKRVFQPLSSVSNDKKILVLAMKSSFYISDSMVHKVCKIYNLNPDDFYSTIQYCKESISNKNEKHRIAVERRNYAYFHHKRYEQELILYKDRNLTVDQKLELERKNKRHTKSWKRLNDKFEEGFLYLRPTNRTIAEILGICERQVSYYINCAKKECLKNKENKKSDYSD